MSRVIFNRIVVKSPQQNSAEPWKRSGGWPVRLGIGAGYAVLAIALTWPVATAIGDHLPLGPEKVASVPALNAWTVWWNGDRARYGFTEYWNAPIFAPSHHALAFSEAQLTTIIVAPILYAAGPAAAYNIYLLTVLTLNGVATCRLLTRVELALLPAVIGGGLVETLPIVHWQLGVLQLTTICGVVWVFDRLIAFRDRPNVVNSLWLGVAACVCYAACNYFGLFLSVLLPLTCLPLLFGRWLDWRFWLGGFASLIVAAVLCSPILWAQFEAKREYQWSREESLLASLSAKPRDYFTPPWRALIEGPDLKDAKRPLWMLGGGPFKLLLAAAGVVAGLCTRGRRRWTLFLALFGGVAFVLSLGPPFEVRGWSAYKLIMAVHPELALARSPFRFAFFVQLAIALLAANVIDALWRSTWWGARRIGSDSVRDEPIDAAGGASVSLGSRRAPPLRIAIVTVGGALSIAIGSYAAIEVWPARQTLFAMPSLDQAWIRWLVSNSDPDSPVLCLPFPAGSTVEDYERTAIFMLEQMGHRRPMVGGYSGFFPPGFLRLKDMMQTFPDDAVIAELRSRKVHFVVIADPALFAVADRATSLRLAFRDGDAKVRIYQVLPPPIDYDRFFEP
jgi:hypothetical protein